MCPHETKMISSTSDGRAALQRRNTLKKIALKTPPPAPPSPPPRSAKSRPLSSASPTSPKLRSPRPPAVKRGNENNSLSSSSDKIILPRAPLMRSVSSLERKKSKKWGVNNNNGVTRYGIDHIVSDIDPSLMLRYSSSLITEAPGSIAAVRRDQIALQHAERKMKTAHYGRSKSAKYEAKVSPLVESLRKIKTSETPVHERRCTSVTPNSDALFVAYHDKEWGVPVHDDKMLFELLVLSGAQVGSDWTSILRRRQDFR
uniref:DNA-3-methyladenine glycosylase I n=2 Tax=Chenopodium quinoa TaxID=63459 RepID=A0A803MZ75_CHEQI